jgi:hypothetical protein
MLSIDPRVVTEYRRIQASGGPSAYFPENRAASALEQARIVVRFRELEDMGLCRLRAEPDEDYRWNEFDPKESERFGDDGAWGSIVEVRTDPDDDDSWEEVDSCWGHVGYRDVLDPTENPYIVDHMRAAVDWLENALTQAEWTEVSPAGSD